MLLSLQLKLVVSRADDADPLRRHQPEQPGAAAAAGGVPRVQPAGRRQVAPHTLRRGMREHGAPPVPPQTVRTAPVPPQTVCTR